MRKQRWPEKTEKKTKNIISLDKPIHRPFGVPRSITEHQKFVAKKTKTEKKKKKKHLTVTMRLCIGACKMTLAHITSKTFILG